MTYQRTILFTLLLSLGALLSACGTDAALSNELAEDLPDGWVAIENPGGLGTAAVPDGFIICFYEDVNYGGNGFCGEDRGINMVNPRIPEAFNDRISSVEIRPGARVLLALFTGGDFQGDKLLLTADAPNVGGFNDQISSYELTVLQ